jgi:thioredoxin reductase (NADPH)
LVLIDTFVQLIRRSGSGSIEIWVQGIVSGNLTRPFECPGVRRLSVGELHESSSIQKEEDTVNGKIVIYGLESSAAGYEIRDFLTRNGLDYDWIELHSDEEAQRLAGVSALKDPRLPLCVVGQASKLYRPSLRDLAVALEWFKGPRYEYYDLAIFGAGPAGLSAALYSASEGLRTIIVEKTAVGGQAGSTSRIENYMGFPDGISGWELASRARQQALRMGAEIIVAGEGVACERQDGWQLSWLASGERIASKATICATGVEYSRLGLEREHEFLNRGLYYGAGSSEAAICKGHVVIVGGGNSAGQAALNFARKTQVTMLVRGECLKDTLSAYLLERIEETSSIKVLTKTTLTSLEGRDALERITYCDQTSGRIASIETHSVFVCIGGKPRTDWSKPGVLHCDPAGYVLTGPDLERSSLSTTMWSDGRAPLFMETSIPGLFAAGDVRHNSTKRCAAAAGDGATAVSMAHRFLLSVKHQLYGPARPV